MNDDDESTYTVETERKEERVSGDQVIDGLTTFSWAVGYFVLVDGGDIRYVVYGCSHDGDSRIKLRNTL